MASGEQTTLAERKRRAGQRMMVGLQGHAVDDDLRRLVRALQPAGFVLFARNVDSPAQVLDLNRELASLVDAARPALLAVDQEGGRVQRVRDGATRFPPMRQIGGRGVAGKVGAALATELHAMGFNLNFAPVADVDSNPANPIIGDRAFGADPQRVATDVADFITAHQAAGVIACAKHFPGHGDTHVDSHLTLPQVDRDEATLRAVELPPFQAAMAAGVGTVMTSHVVYPAWDETLPATLSAPIIRDLLRQELGYDGVVFSDDLEMKAVRGRYSAEQQVMLSTRATVDVLLCCDRADVQEEIFETLVRAQEQHADIHATSKVCAARVHRLRETHLRRRPVRPPLAVVGSRAHKNLITSIVGGQLP